jgi:hypothetical protein
VTDKENDGKEIVVGNNTSICNITGDPELDEILDKMSIFGHNPVADAISKQFGHLMSFMPPAAMEDNT